MFLTELLPALRWSLDLKCQLREQVPLSVLGRYLRATRGLYVLQMLRMLGQRLQLLLITRQGIPASKLLIAAHAVCRELGRLNLIYVTSDPSQ